MKHIVKQFASMSQIPIAVDVRIIDNSRDKESYYQWWAHKLVAKQLPIPIRIEKQFKQHWMWN